MYIINTRLFNINYLHHYNKFKNKSVDRYLSPVSGNIVTITFPLFSELFDT